jgi:hypothetical protein
MEYLGLIAHFWDADGVAREWAFLTLEDVDFEPPLTECLQQAKAALQKAGKFDTADAVARMIAAGGA